MSALIADGADPSQRAPIHLSYPAPGIIAALFFGYLCVGLPLPVIPLFLHDKLGFNSFIVGLVVGILRLRRYPVIDWLLIAYIELFRCTPLLVQII